MPLLVTGLGPPLLFRCAYHHRLSPVFLFLLFPRLVAEEGSSVLLVEDGARAGGRTLVCSGELPTGPRLPPTGSRARVSQVLWIVRNRGGLASSLSCSWSLVAGAGRQKTGGRRGNVLLEDLVAEDRKRIRGCRESYFLLLLPVMAGVWRAPV